MPTLTLILLVSLAGAVLSIAAAALVALTVRRAWIPLMISYAVGALLGAAFLEIIPEAYLLLGDAERLAATLLGGILLFFILEKLVIWRHCHGDHCEAHQPHEAGNHAHGAAGAMVIVGDVFHNFVDGVLITAAFLTDVQLGLVTTLAIFAHEIPQEVSNFLVLLHSGYSKRRAILLNLLSSLGTVVGALLAYFALRGLEAVIPYCLGLAAASMIYIAVADLIPGLHKRSDLSAGVAQVVLIGCGIGSILLMRVILGHHH